LDNGLLYGPSAVSLHAVTLCIPFVRPSVIRWVDGSSRTEKYEGVNWPCDLQMY